MMDSKPVALVVEDDTAISEALAELLSDDYEPLCVTYVREAMDTISARDVAVVILDWMLVGETGEALLKELATREASPPVVLLSASPEARAASGTYRIPLVTKPFDFDRLLVVMEEARTQKTRPHVKPS
jgi:DNA-binding response OmpR family regulator